MSSVTLDQLEIGKLYKPAAKLGEALLGCWPGNAFYEALSPTEEGWVKLHYMSKGNVYFYLGEGNRHFRKHSGPIHGHIFLCGSKQIIVHKEDLDLLEKIEI
jgi:hypothetical protein